MDKNSKKRIKIQSVLRAAGVCAMCLWFGKSAAQNNGFHVGVFAAPQVSFLTNPNDNASAQLSVRGRWGAAYGVLAGFDLQRHYGLELNLYRGEFGANYLVRDGEQSHRAATTLSYWKIPVYFRVNSEPSRRVHVYGFAGPQLSILGGARQGFGDGQIVTTNYLTALGDTTTALPLFSSKDLYKKITIDAVMGMGLNVRVIPNLYFVTALRFEHTLTDIENKNFRASVNGVEINPWLTANGGATRKNTAAASVGLQMGFSYFIGIPPRKAKAEQPSE